MPGPDTGHQQVFRTSPVSWWEVWTGPPPPIPCTVILSLSLVTWTAYIFASPSEHSGACTSLRVSLLAASPPLEAFSDCSAGTHSCTVRDTLPQATPKERGWIFASCWAPFPPQANDSADHSPFLSDVSSLFFTEGEQNPLLLASLENNLPFPVRTDSEGCEVERCRHSVQACPWLFPCCFYSLTLALWARAGWRCCSSRRWTVSCVMSSHPSVTWNDQISEIKPEIQQCVASQRHRPPLSLLPWGFGAGIQSSGSHLGLMGAHCQGLLTERSLLRESCRQQTLSRAATEPAQARLGCNPSSCSPSMAGLWWASFKPAQPWQALLRDRILCKEGSSGSWWKRTGNG